MKRLRRIFFSALLFLGTLVVLSENVVAAVPALFCPAAQNRAKLGAVSASVGEVYKENFRTQNQPIRDKGRYFQEIQWQMKAMLPEIRQILSEINNQLGSDIEIAQTRAFLLGVQRQEMAYLDNIKPLENAVVYASTNVPLYTLITQVFLVGSFSKNVWVRTPESTRHIYLKLFRLFETYLPAESTQRIHLVTDPSDLSYDVFNRIFVMGQSRNGQKSVRPPAELVVLTGNPDTARTLIERNIRGLHKVSEQSSENLTVQPTEQGTQPNRTNQQQLFLGFLAGVNPAIVVPSARTNLAHVVDKLVFPFLVNGGQDCMNSDVVFVHSQVAGELQSSLIKKFSTLKMIGNEDRDQGLSPLTMSKNFDKLSAFRAKYEKYLVNKDARIDEKTKRVSAHLFVIPASEFKDLDIQEHFAPFLVMVKYDSRSQLEKLSLNPRLQKKAMAALVFGGTKMTKDIEEARDVFRQSQHAVVTNTNLYEEMEMNSPFGGVGTDTSISTLARIEGPRQVHVLNRNRPLLISKEVEEAFPLKNEAPAIENQPDPSLIVPEWMSEPRYQLSLRQIQRRAQQDGLWIATAWPPKTKEAREEFEKLYGLQPLNREAHRRVPGLVLHPSSIGKFVENPTAKGSVNLMIGDSSLNKRFEGSKREELNLVRAVDPSLMPGVHAFEEAVAGTRFGNDFEQLRSELLQTLTEASQDRHDDGFDGREILSPEKLNNKVSILVTSLLRDLASKYPRGAYVKNYGEYASGDVGNSVTTFNASPKQIAQEFSLWFFQGLSKVKTKGYQSADFQKYLTQGMHSNSARFVNRLLLNPGTLLVQERLDLQTTHLGAPMEFRVDFIEGLVVGSRMRFGLEHYPREAEKAAEVLRDFLAKAPPAIRGLSGGADVALTRDGRWVVFEFNFGGASGTMMPEYYPLESNKIFSVLLGRNTWLLNQISNLARRTPQHQREFILAQKNEKPLWWKPSFSDISQLEWAKWIRDYKLDAWRKSADKSATAEKLQQQLADLLLPLGTSGNQDFVRLYESALHFIRRELANIP